LPLAARRTVDVEVRLDVDAGVRLDRAAVALVAGLVAVLDVLAGN
jgi:hypothetical protein